MSYSNLTKTIALSVGVLAMVFLISYFVLAWTEPTLYPPGGNVPAPLNVSLNAQSKEGALIIGSNIGPGTGNPGITTALVVPFANVGIGITTPNNLIQVKNLINFDNTLHSTALGFQALTSNTGDQNTAVGYRALYNNSSSFAEDNTAVGFEALYSNISGTDNTALGFHTLYSNTGHDNTAVGNSALYSNTSASENTAVGRLALSSNTTGGENTAVGTNVLRSNTTGYKNTAIGRHALASNTTGYHNTTLGYGADVASGSLTNATAIGYQATVSCSDCLVLGNTNTSVGIGTASPGAKLEVAGQVKITGGNPGADKVLTSDANGLATWQVPSGGGTQPQYAMAYCYCRADGIMEFCGGPATPGICASNEVSMRCSEGTILSGGCFGVMNNAYLLRSYPSSLWIDWVNTPAFDTWTCAFSANTDKMVFVHCQK